MDASATTAGQQQTIPLPTGQEIYDTLMGEIEPELVTDNLPHLEERYPNETEEHRTARYERYTKAYEAYDAAFEKWSLELQADVSAYRREALKEAEGQSKTEETQSMAALEAAMIDAAPLSPTTP